MSEHNCSAHGSMHASAAAFGGLALFSSDKDDTPAKKRLNSLLLLVQQYLPFAAVWLLLSDLVEKCDSIRCGASSDF